MKFACFWVTIFSLNIAFIRAEYIVCASSQHSEACKRIEATKKDIKCLKVADSFDCLQNIRRKKAHFGVFTPEEAILASHYINDDLSVVAEVRHPERTFQKFAFETVVLVHKNFTGGLSALKGSSYCHPGFSQGRYWSDRVLKHFENHVIRHFEKTIDRSEHERARRTAKEEELYMLSSIFSKACRPGAWSVSDWWDKKLKRDYYLLCAKCDYPSTCSYKAQPSNEHFSALKCLTEYNGDVAYTALEYVLQYFNLQGGVDLKSNPEDYHFLCMDGSTRPISAEDTCSWLRQPWTSVLASKSVADDVTNFLKNATAEGNSRLPGWKAALKQILTNGDGILEFHLKNIKVASYIEEGRTIPKYDPSSRTLDWCTINAQEKSKCELMAYAALTYGIPIQITCSLSASKVGCLKRIQRNESDITFIDTELGFEARQVYNLTPAAFAETEKAGNYYGVIVTKEKSIRRLRDLKNKKACFPRYNGLGWLSHVQNVRHHNLVPNMLCSDSRVLWNFFSKACAPGAKSTDINIFSDMTPSKLCQACSTTQSGSLCDATPENPYYSDVGALRCLNNGHGDVAVLDFHIAKQYLESNEDGMSMDKFRILCRDETISDFSLEDPEECSITQLNGGEIVMRNNLSLEEKRDIVLTLIELDDVFGHSLKQYPPIFKMYEPFDGQPGVLFKESSVALISVFDTQNEYVNNYLKLHNEMKACYRDNKARKVYLSLILILSALILIFIE